MDPKNKDRYNMEETPCSLEEYERRSAEQFERDIEQADYMRDWLRDQAWENEQLTGAEPHSA